MTIIRNVSTATWWQARAAALKTRSGAVRACVLSALALGAVAGVAAWAAQPSREALPTPPATAASPATPLQPVHPLDAADLETWLDGMLPATLEQGKVAGAVVSVVKDGKLLFAKGYGYADMESKTPMDAERTLIRPGSVSKLLTWTAVMQLAEQGKIDLNADVNRYLDFKLPERDGRPITVNDLMMHRTGFEEGLKDVLVNDPAQLQTLSDSLKKHVRPALFAPGEVPAYSNYGAGLAGYIVERVSGEPYADYVARHILAPLGMKHSTFAQPLPPAFAADMSKGYRSSDGAPQPFEMLAQSPAGAMSATATDMAQFMLVHLQDGSVGSAQILRPETVRLMHSPSLKLPAGFDTMAHGFFLGERNGRTILEHGGDSIVFHSDLQLIPAERTGLFISFNSRGEGDSVYGMRERLMKAFMDRYFPAPATAEPQALSTAKAHAQEIAGRYESSRRVQSGFISLFYVLQGQEAVSANADGTIGLASDPGKTFREVAPYIWRETGGTRQLQLTHVDGTKTIVDGRNPAGVFQAVPLKRDAGLNGPIFLFALLGLIAATIAWIIAEGARRYYRQPPSLTGRPLLIRRLTRIATVANLAWLAGWFIVLKPILSIDVAFYTAALDPVIRLLQVAAVIPIAGAVLGVWNAWLSLRSKRSWIIKAGSILVALVLIGTVWIGWVGGLMDFTLNY